MASLLLWAAWGLGGAFAYAAPRLLAEIFDGAPEGRRPLRGVLQFATALTLGPIAGAGLGPWIAIDLSWKGEAECRALAVLVGLCVNPVAPAAVRLLTDFTLARLGHPLARRKSGP